MIKPLYAPPGERGGRPQAFGKCPRKKGAKNGANSSKCLVACSLDRGLVCRQPIARCGALGTERPQFGGPLGQCRRQGSVCRSRPQAAGTPQVDSKGGE